MNNSKPKILIIEDEPAILRALALAFTREGFDAVTAGDGEEGLASAMREKPDAILLDIVMPKMDGIEMLRHVRMSGGEWGASVKVIVYTNLSYNEKREEARIVGVNDFIVKANVGLGEIVARIRRELLSAKGPVKGGPIH